MSWGQTRRADEWTAIRSAGTASKEAAYGRGAVRRRALPPEFYLIYMVSDPPLYIYSSQIEKVLSSLD
jgi:hypothetical protein